MVRNRDAHAGGPAWLLIDSHGVRGLLWCATAVTVLILSVAARAELPPTAVQQQPAAKSGDATIDTVTVEARRRRELLEHQLSTFVSAITMPAGQESLVRWQLPICPLVAGLPFDEGKFVFQRVSQVASEAGVALGPPDCTPNLLVVMTREPEAVLKNWWGKNPRMFNNDRGVAGIERMIRTPAPVRVFYNACSVPAEMANRFAISVIGHCGKPGIPDSRLTWSTVRVLYSVIIVVDKRQTEGLELGPLTDYIAMISLAHIRRNTDVGAAPTILRLFDEPDASRPRVLSTWDRAFLKSLYDTGPSSVTHLSEIKRRMKRDVVR